MYLFEMPESPTIIPRSHLTVLNGQGVTQAKHASLSLPVLVGKHSDSTHRPPLDHPAPNESVQS